MNRDQTYHAIDKAICDRWFGVYQSINPLWSRWLPADQSGSVKVDCMARIRDALYWHYNMGGTF